MERLRARGALAEVEVISPGGSMWPATGPWSWCPEDADICVCTDLDEVFHPGWRARLEEAWLPEAGQATYRYTWSFNPDGSEGVTFWYEKAHARHGYQWVHPVHEVLKWDGDWKARPHSGGGGSPAGPPPRPFKV